MERRVAIEGSAMRLEDLEGDILADRFRLERMVGQGGYGAVFEAIQLSVGRRCAVKIMLPGRSTNESVEKRFRDEARATSRLTHPNSLVLYDFGVDEKTGFLFLATEFLDGCTLHDVLEEKKTVEVRRTVSIMKQVAASLQDAHSLGLVHRDIKPKNIMLVERAQTTDFVKVIDFGIAKALRGQLSRETDLTRTGMLIGTPKYMAPEQILGQEMDGRVDQYVLAVVGYRMLTGRNPFRTGAPMETAMCHVNDRVLPLRSYRPELKVTAEFEDAFLRALEKSPEYRFERIIDFVDALEASMDERMFANEAAKKEKRAPVAAVADSGSAKTTEKLGAVLSARIGGREESGITSIDMDEGDRTTATVILEPGIMDGENDDETEECDERRKAEAADDGDRSPEIDDEVSPETTAMIVAESTLERPTASTDDKDDDKRSRSGGGAGLVWMAVLASVSLLSVSVVMVMLFAGGGDAEQQGASVSSVAVEESAAKEISDEEGEKDTGLAAVDEPPSETGPLEFEEGADVRPETVEEVDAVAAEEPTKEKEEPPSIETGVVAGGEETTVEKAHREVGAGAETTGGTGAERAGSTAVEAPGRTVSEASGDETPSEVAEAPDEEPKKETDDSEGAIWIVD